MTKKAKSKRGRKQRRKPKVDAVKTVTKQDEQQELEVKMQRLQLNLNVMNSAEDDDLLEEAIKLAAAEKKEIEAFEAKMNCTHGYESDEYIERFYQAFFTALVEARNRMGNDAGLELFDEAYNATLSDFVDVWNDSTKIVKVVQYLASYGTALYLKGNKQTADGFACFANYFEQFAKINVDNTQAVLHANKIFELCRSDDHTLTSFYRRRIPCSCLDEIYKEVKSMKKKGFCWNVHCKHFHFFQDGAASEWKLDRSSLLSCSRCRNACYCSVECQKVHWPEHKRVCDNAVAKRNAFEEAKCYRAI